MTVLPSRRAFMASLSAATAGALIRSAPALADEGPAQTTPNGPLGLDSEGYIPDRPLGAYVQFNRWLDYQSVWKEDTITFLIEMAYRDAHKNDPHYNDEEDPMFEGLRHLFVRMVQINYKNKVTGPNLQALEDELRHNIAKAGSVPLVDVQGIYDISLFLNPLGDYFGQLAKRLPSGGFQTDMRGDILRLKFVTHGNYVKFTISLDFAGQLAGASAPVVGPGVFFSGDPSFTVTFDTVTTIDLQLPHRSADGFQVVQAIVRAVGAEVHSENLSGNVFLDVVNGPIARGVNGWQTDLSTTVNNALQPMKEQLNNQAKFDQAEYFLDGNAVRMRLTQNPYRDFLLQIDYIADLFPGSVRNRIMAQVGVPGTFAEVQLGLFGGVEAYIPVGRHYPDGTRTILVEIQIWRDFIHTTVGGSLVNFGDHYYIYYLDGSTLDLGPNFNPHDPGSAELLKGLIPRHNPAPPGKSGLNRTIYLVVDYALEYITGRYPELVGFQDQGRATNSGARHRYHSGDLVHSDDRWHSQ